MKVTDYLGSYLNDKSNSLDEKTQTSWQNLKKGVATGITMLMLSTAAAGILSQPAYAHHKEKNKQEQPVTQPHAETKYVNVTKKKSLTNIIFGLGTKTISQETSQVDPFSNKFFSSEINVLYSPKDTMLIHANLDINSMHNTYTSGSEEGIYIFNGRTGVLYSPAKPFTIGGEISYNSTSQFNTDFNNPVLDPRTKWTNQDVLLLVKAGLGNFGKNAFALHGIAGLHYQNQSLKDNVYYAHFTHTKQDDLNYVLGGEAFIYLGRNSDSLFEFILSANDLKLYPLTSITKGGVIPELISGNLLDLKAICAVKVMKGFKLGVGANYGNANLKYKNNFSIKQDRFGIEFFMTYNLNQIKRSGVI